MQQQEWSKVGDDILPSGSIRKRLCVSDPVSRHGKNEGFQDLFSWRTIHGDPVWSDMSSSSNSSGEKTQADDFIKEDGQGWMIKETVYLFRSPVVRFIGPFSGKKEIQDWIAQNFEQSKNSMREGLTSDMKLQPQDLVFQHIVDNKSQTNGFYWSVLKNGKKYQFLTHMYTY